MNRTERQRRTLLSAGGTALAVAMAGCSSVVLDRIGGGDGHGDGEEDGDGGGTEVPEGVPEEVHTFLVDGDANLYDGTVDDQTGEDSVTIMNGAGDNNVAFEQPLVRIDAGTEVTWEWTGLGGAHNVSPQEGDLEGYENPDGLIDEEGHTWSYTFEEAGSAMYQCDAHVAQGQIGAVIVE